MVAVVWHKPTGTIMISLEVTGKINESFKKSKQNKILSFFQKWMKVAEKFLIDFLYNTFYYKFHIANWFAQNASVEFCQVLYLQPTYGGDLITIWQNQAINKCLITIWFSKEVAYVIDKQGEFWPECPWFFSFTIKTKMKQQIFLLEICLFINEGSEFFAQSDDRLEEYVLPQFLVLFTMYRYTYDTLLSLFSLCLCVMLPLGPFQAIYMMSLNIKLGREVHHYIVFPPYTYNRHK